MPLTMTRRVVSFRVLGEAIPQGSHKAFMRPGMRFPVVVHDNPKLKAWRQLVASEAQRVAGDGLFLGPVAVGIVFAFARPKSLPKRVVHHTVRPDCDKVLRGVFDALTGVLYRDDAQVVRAVLSKVYAPIGSGASVQITVAEAADPAPLQTAFTVEDLFAEEAVHAQA